MRFPWSCLSLSLCVSVLALRCRLVTYGAPQFDHAVVNFGIDLTFNVSDVRAFLAYCEGRQNCSVVARFFTSGSPMLWETGVRPQNVLREDDNGGLYQCIAEELGPDEKDDLHFELVIATLSDNTSQQQTPTPTPQPVRTPTPSQQAAMQQHEMHTSQRSQHQAQVAHPASSQVRLSQQQQQQQQGVHASQPPSGSQHFLAKQSGVMRGEHATEDASVPPTP
jgi:hypothetical protein